MILSTRKKYLQVALNSTLSDAYSIIEKLPRNDRIIIEAGTPLIKQYGIDVVAQIKRAWSARLYGLAEAIPYVVADLKTMDRADTEVQMAKDAGASAAVVLGQAPVETLNRCIETCRNLKFDSMVDMMNVEQPIKILRRLHKQPDVVILHRGVDEETFNKDKPIPYIQINKIRSSYSTFIAIAGGDTIREVQRAIFNDADIVVVWRQFYHASSTIDELASEFLKQIK